MKAGYAIDNVFYICKIHLFIQHVWEFGMATIRLASFLKIDSIGYTSALLSIRETIQSVNNNKNNKRSLMTDKRDIECIELAFACENTRNEPFVIKSLIFGLVINPEPTGKVRDGSKLVTAYNKLTTTLLRLGIVNKSDLENMASNKADLDVETIMAEFYAVKDLPVRFKPQKNSEGFWEPNLLTLEVIKES